MKTVNEYLIESIEIRQNHLDLNEKCMERGGNSTNHRGVLAQYLNTPIYGRPADLCHACHNGKCSNPKHLYWGTRKENVQDSKDNGTHLSAWERTVEKYGLEKAKEINSKNGKMYGHLGGKKGKGKLKSESHKDNIKNGVERAYRLKVIAESRPLEYGWIARASKKLNVSHTEIRRFVKKEGIETYKRNR